VAVFIFTGCQLTNFQWSLKMKILDFAFATSLAAFLIIVFANANSLLIDQSNAYRAIVSMPIERQCHAYALADQSNDFANADFAVEQMSMLLAPIGIEPDEFCDL
jgi:hypothetical protein